MWKRNSSFSCCIQEIRYESCIENFWSEKECTYFHSNANEIRIRYLNWNSFLYTQHQWYMHFKIWFQTTCTRKEKTFENPFLSFFVTEWNQQLSCCSVSGKPNQYFRIIIKGCANQAKQGQWVLQAKCSAIKGLPSLSKVKFKNDLTWYPAQTLLQMLPQLKLKIQSLKQNQFHCCGSTYKWSGKGPQFTRTNLKSLRKFSKSKSPQTYLQILDFWKQ